MSIAAERRKEAVEVVELKLTQDCERCEQQEEEEERNGGENTVHWGMEAG